uniref:Uncharacterized protein n=1 Tax=Anopheles arabiensis TaxID=7173 RepID=A0A182ICH6_ANOAR
MDHRKERHGGQIKTKSHPGAMDRRNEHRGSRVKAKGRPVDHRTGIGTVTQTDIKNGISRKMIAMAIVSGDVTVPTAGILPTNKAGMGRTDPMKNGTTKTSDRERVRQEGDEDRQLTPAVVPGENSNQPQPERPMSFIDKLIADEAMRMLSKAASMQETTYLNVPFKQTEAAALASASADSAATESSKTESEKQADEETQASMRDAAVVNAADSALLQKSAEQVTKKLINQLTTMSKYDLKQIIDNPGGKYETALNRHAQNKLRAEVRKQLKTIGLNELGSASVDGDGSVEPDEAIDANKIPPALLAQIGQALDLDLEDLTHTDSEPFEQVADAAKDSQPVEGNGMLGPIFGTAVPWGTTNQEEMAESSNRTLTKVRVAHKPSPTTPGRKNQKSVPNGNAIICIDDAESPVVTIPPAKAKTPNRMKSPKGKGVNGKGGVQTVQTPTTANDDDSIQNQLNNSDQATDTAAAPATTTTATPTGQEQQQHSNIPIFQRLIERRKKRCKSAIEKHLEDILSKKGDTRIISEDGEVIVDRLRNNDYLAMVCPSLRKALPFAKVQLLPPKDVNRKRKNATTPVDTMPAEGQWQIETAPNMTNECSTNPPIVPDTHMGKVPKNKLRWNRWMQANSPDMICSREAAEKNGEPHSGASERISSVSSLSGEDQILNEAYDHYTSKTGEDGGGGEPGDGDDVITSEPVQASPNSSAEVNRPCIRVRSASISQEFSTPDTSFVEGVLNEDPEERPLAEATNHQCSSEPPASQQSAATLDSVSISNLPATEPIVDSKEDIERIPSPEPPLDTSTATEEYILGGDSEQKCVPMEMERYGDRSASQEQVQEQAQEQEQPATHRRVATPQPTQQPTRFQPLYEITERLQSIDAETMDLYNRKAQIDAMIMQLNSERMDINQQLVKLHHTRGEQMNDLRITLLELGMSDSPPGGTEVTNQSPTTCHASDVTRNADPVHHTVHQSAPPPAQPQQERTIRRITPIGGNSVLMKIFQRRRAPSERSTEDNPPPNDLARKRRRRYSSATSGSSNLFTDLNNNELLVPIVNPSRSRFKVSACIYKHIPSSSDGAKDCSKEQSPQLAVQIFEGSDIKLRNEPTIPVSMERFLAFVQMDCPDDVLVSTAYCVPRMVPVSNVSFSYAHYDTERMVKTIVHCTKVEFRRRYLPVAKQTIENDQHNNNEEESGQQACFITYACWNVSEH